jgi:hypothetical protein
MATDRTPADRAPDRERRQVFLDAAVLLVEEATSDRRQEPERILVPGAADAVTLLAEGHELTLVDPRGEAAALLSAVAAVTQLPPSYRAGAWYITADEAWCEGDRPSGLQSILVGPRRPPARRPTARCDLEARDLNAAVMEILVRETMA